MSPNMTRRAMVAGPRALLLALCCATVTTISAVPLEAQRQGNRTAVTPRIAVVDLQVLFDSVPGRNAVAAGFADELRLAETRVRLAADSLQRAVQLFSQRQQDLSPTQREAATLTLRARELQLEDMVQRLNASVMERRDALQAPLATCVQRAMRDVQQRDGWHVIMDRDALGALYVVHEDVDVTAQVLEVLRQRAAEPCLAR
jgi:outer membrane protein